MLAQTTVRRLFGALTALVLALGAVVVTTTAAQAWSWSGCKWSLSTLNIRNQMPSGTYSTVAVDSIAAWSNSTDLTLAPTTSTSAAFSIKNYNQGANGYAGYAYTTCIGTITNAQATLNPYYTDGYSTSKKKAVAVHVSDTDSA